MNLNELIPQGVAPVREAIPNYHVARLDNPLAGITDSFSGAARTAVNVYAAVEREKAEAELSSALVDARNEMSKAKMTQLQTVGLDSEYGNIAFNQEAESIKLKYADNLKSERAKNAFYKMISSEQLRASEQIEMHAFSEVRKAKIESIEALIAQHAEAAVSASIPKTEELPQLPSDREANSDEIQAHSEATQQYLNRHFSDLFSAEYYVRQLGKMEGKDEKLVEAEIQNLRDKVFAGQVKRLADSGNFDGAEKLIAFYGEHGIASKSAVSSQEHAISLRQEVKREQDIVSSYFSGYDEEAWKNPEAYSPHNAVAVMKKEFGKRYSGEKLDRIINRAEREINDRHNLYVETRSRCFNEKLLDAANLGLQGGLDALDANPTYRIGDKEYPMTSAEIVEMKQKLHQLTGNSAGTSQSQELAKESILIELGKNPTMSYEEAKKAFVDKGGNLDDTTAKFIRDTLRAPYGDIDKRMGAAAKGLGLRAVPWGFRSLLLSQGNLNDIQSLSVEKIQNAMVKYVNRVKRPVEIKNLIFPNEVDMISTRHDYSAVENKLPFSDQQAAECYYAFRESLDAAYGESWHNDPRARALFFTPWEKLTRRQKVQFVREWLLGELK